VAKVYNSGILKVTCNLPKVAENDLSSEIQHFSRTIHNFFTTAILSVKFYL